MEAKCDDFSKRIDELKRDIQVEKRKNEKIKENQIKIEEAVSPKVNQFTTITVSAAAKIKNEFGLKQTVSTLNGTDSTHFALAATLPTVANNEPKPPDSCSNESNDEFARLVSELDASRRQFNNEQQKVSDLEEQLNMLRKLCVFFYFYFS